LTILNCKLNKTKPHHYIFCGVNYSLQKPIVIFLLPVHYYGYWIRFKGSKPSWQMTSFSAVIHVSSLLTGLCSAVSSTRPIASLPLTHIRGDVLLGNFFHLLYNIISFRFPELNESVICDQSVVHSTYCLGFRGEALNFSAAARPLHTSFTYNK
jgi:hypothetical protein